MKKLLISLVYTILTILGLLAVGLGFAIAVIHYPITMFVFYLLFLISILWTIVYNTVE